MLPLVRDLMAHKAWANAALLRATGETEAAARDESLITLFDHIRLANRFWVRLAQGVAFDYDAENRPSASLIAVIDRFRTGDAEEAHWVDGLAESDLEREVETHHLPGRRFTVAEALVQVALHSHGHRSQLAAKLRALGGTPPTTDFVWWLGEGRPAARWDV